MSTKRASCQDTQGCQTSHLNISMETGSNYIHVQVVANSLSDTFETHQFVHRRCLTITLLTQQHLQYLLHQTRDPLRHINTPALGQNAKSFTYPHNLPRSLFLSSSSQLGTVDAARLPSPRCFVGARHNTLACQRWPGPGRQTLTH